MDNQIQIFKNKRNASFTRNNQLSNSSVQTIYNTQEQPHSVFGGLLSHEKKKEQIQLVHETVNAAYFNSTKHMTLGDFVQMNSRAPAPPVVPQKKTPKEMLTELKAQVAK